MARPLPPSTAVERGLDEIVESSGPGALALFRSGGRGAGRTVVVMRNQAPADELDPLNPVASVAFCAE